MKQTFKILKQAFLASLFLAFLGCSSDDGGSGTDTDPGGNSLTSGKWYYETGDGVEGEFCDKKNNLDFRSDGTFYFELFVGSEPSCVSIDSYTGTYTLDADVITMVFGSETFSGTFSISDGILTYEGESPFMGGSSISTYDHVSG